MATVIGSVKGTPIYSGSSASIASQYAAASGGSTSTSTASKTSSSSSSGGGSSGGGQVITQGQSFVDTMGRTGIAQFNPNTGQRLSSGQSVTVNSSSMGATEPIPTAPKPLIPDYSGLLNKAVGDAAISPTEQTVQQSQTDLFSQYLKSQKAQPDLASIQTKLEQDNQIQQKREAKNQYQTQLNSIVTQAQAQNLALEGQGRGQTSSFVGGEQARINREAAIKALPVQALLSAASQDLETAQSHVDKMFQIYAKDAENQVNYFNRQADLAYNFLDKQQQNQLQTIRDEKSFQQNLLLKNIDTQQGYANEALKNGNIRLFNAITGIRPPTDLNSATYKTDLATYNKEMNNAVAKYGQTGTSGGGGSTGARVLSSLPVSIQGKVIAAAEKFGTTDIVKKFNSTADSINVVNGIQANSTNPADHQAIVYAFAKALDPDSAVKEGEYDTIKKYAQSAVSRYGKEITNALNGTGFLSEKAITDIKTTMNNLYTSRKPQYDNAYAERSRVINNIAGADIASELLTDYSGGANIPIIDEVKVKEDQTFDDVVSKPTGYWSKLWGAITGN